MATSLEEENRLLREKVSQLIADNLALDNDYDPNKPVRKLTLQEKLEINMGLELKKYRISVQDIKKLYYDIVSSEKEPQYFDLTFDKDRICNAYYKVDIEKEKKEIEKGEDVEVDITKLDNPRLEQKYDVEKVLNQITDIESK